MMSATDEYNREQYVAELKEDCANYSKAMVEAERRANKLEKEAESLRNQVAALHDAMRSEWKDLLARAEKAEAEVEWLRKSLLAYGRHLDHCGDSDAYNNADIETCGCGLDSLLSHIQTQGEG